MFSVLLNHVSVSLVCRIQAEEVVKCQISLLFLDLEL